VRHRQPGGGPRERNGRDRERRRRRGTNELARPTSCAPPRHDRWGTELHQGDRPFRASVLAGKAHGEAGLVQAMRHVYHGDARIGRGAGHLGLQCAARACLGAGAAKLAVAVAERHVWRAVQPRTPSVDPCQHKVRTCLDAGVTALAGRQEVGLCQRPGGPHERRQGRAGRLLGQPPLESWQSSEEDLTPGPGLGHGSGGSVGAESFRRVTPAGRRTARVWEENRRWESAPTVVPLRTCSAPTA